MCKATLEKQQEQIRELAAVFYSALTRTMETACMLTDGPEYEWKFDRGLVHQVLIQKTQPSIQPLPEDIQLHLKKLVQDIAPGFWERVCFSNFGITPDLRQILESMVRKIWRKIGRLNDADAEKCHETNSFIESIVSKQCKYVMIGPIQNLDAILTASHSIRLTDSIGVRKLTSYELERIWGYRSHLSFRANDCATEYAVSYELCVDMKFGRENEPNDDFSDACRLIRLAEMSMRLAKGGSLACSRIYAIPLAGWFDSPTFGGDDLGYSILRSSVTLDENDVHVIPRHWERLRNGCPRDINFALQRLNLAELRKDPRDKILDAAIGLEGLLLRSGKANSYRGELRYRFAINYSVLADNLSDRRRRFERARRIYDLRSVIAHSGSERELMKVCEKECPLEIAAAECCSMLREVILLFLENGSPASEQFWLDRLFASETEGEE